ncbi:MAG: hypothetical protein ACI4J4_05675 [Ruminiclostridium sp.]
MFEKLYGETEEIQFEFLKKRLIISAILLPVFGIAIYMWGWSFLKNWFGWATVGAIFTGNIVFGVVIIVLFLLVGALVGIVNLFMGIGRFIYLCVKRSQNK